MKVDTLIRAVGGLTVQEKGAWIADGRIIPWKAAGREVLGGMWQELIPPPPPGYATSLGMFHTHPLDYVPELSDEDRFFVFANNVDWQCVATGKGHVCEHYKKDNEYRIASEIAKKIILGEYDTDILGQKFREFESLRLRTTTSNLYGTGKTVYIAGMPEAKKDNRARMQELGNLLREGGFEITGRQQKEPGQMTTEEFTKTDAEIKVGKFEIIYRGEGGTSYKGGSYWSPSAEWAKQFTQTGRIEEVKKAFIKSDDIYTAKELPYAGDPDAIDKAVAHAKNKGFKAVRLSEGTNEPLSVYVFDLTALKSVSAMAGGVMVMETLTPTREPWQMTRGEFAKTAVALPSRKDFIKAWLKDNEDIPDLVKPGFNYIEQRNGSLLVFGNQRGQAIGIISMHKDAVEHIAVSDRYKGKGIATQLLEESRKYGVRRIIEAISPEVVGIVHRFTVKTAFLEGKPVPQEVLREYPDLVVKSEKQRWRKV